MLQIHNSRHDIGSNQQPNILRLSIWNYLQREELGKISPPRRK